MASQANGVDPNALPREPSPSGSPRTASVSLHAAAAMNASLQHEPMRRSSSSSLSRSRASPQTGRRRSTVLMNLQLNDPTLPPPGEMVGDSQLGPRTSSPHSTSGSPLLVGRDPHHHRTPSLGELHQELEAEQEAHVNRLLHMIRQQQQQLQSLQSAQGHGASGHPEDSSAVSERSGRGTPIPISASQSSISNVASAGSLSRSPGLPHHPRSSFDMARADLHRRSRTPSRGASPQLRATSISAESGDHVSLGGRDESAFYQAETQMLVRENQMLRHRVRELEKQLLDLTSNTANVTHEPPQHSHLMQSHSASGDSPDASKDA